MKSESKRPISLEDLLRLKRAERPPVEFWATFDRELRAKQLSALVEKRPWWQRMPKVALRLPRYRIAFGAVAIACLTIFSAKSFRTTPSSTPADRPAVVATSVTETAVAPAAIARVEVAPAVAPTVVSTNLDAVAAAPAVEPVVVADISSPGTIDRLPAAPAVETLTPSARHIAANLAKVQTSDPVSAKGLLAVASIEPRNVPARIAVEPLQQMTPPDESRRARYFTAMVSTTSLDSSVRTAERAANRIAEEQLYDRVRRLDARGDRLKWKL
jgi:hypothetical protein